MADGMARGRRVKGEGMSVTHTEDRLEELRGRFVPHAYVQHHPMFATSGSGSWVRDASGRRYLDMTGGIAVQNVGHRHPKVIAAIKQQADRLLHIGPVALHEGYVLLAAAIAQRVPGAQEGKQVLFLNSGAEAVENAVKVARHATGRPAIIAFDRSFHGRTLLTSTLTGKSAPYKIQPGSLAPEVYHAPYPYPYRPPEGVDPERLTDFCLGALNDLVMYRVRSEKVAAVIVEPVQGEGGYIVPPPGFLSALGAWCREIGALLIVDEIQTGYGRTGRMFASEHEGIVPDILILGKSIAAGLPLAAVVANSSIFDRVTEGDIGGTYGGNPIACAAGLAVLDVFDDGLLDRADLIATATRRILEQLAWEYPRIGEVRGQGAMLAIELVTDPESREPDPALADAVVSEARDRELLLIKAGIFANVVRLLPPLTVSDQELTVLSDRLRIAMRAAMRANPSGPPLAT